MYKSKNILQNVLSQTFYIFIFFSDLERDKVSFIMFINKIILILTL